MRPKRERDDTVPAVENLYPATVRVRDGQLLSTKGDVWRLRAAEHLGITCNVSFRPLRAAGAQEQFVDIVKAYVADCAPFVAPQSLQNITAAANRFATFVKDRSGKGAAWNEVAALDLRAFHAQELATTGAGADFSRLRQLYEWGAFVAQLPGFRPHSAVELRGVLARGGKKGLRVMTGDDRYGPLDQQEINTIWAALQDIQGDLADAVVVQLFLELGVRPISAAGILATALREYAAPIPNRSGPQVRRRYTLLVPRAKQRHGRVVLRERPVSALLARRLQSLAENARVGSLLLHWIPQKCFHANVNRRMKAWAERHGVRSERTGEIIKLTPYRFRYTLATEAVRDGASRFQLAEILDHERLSSGGVYVDAVAGVLKYIGPKLDAALGPILHRHFRGVIESEGSSPGLPTVTGFFPQLPAGPVLGGIGRCGREVNEGGVCELAPPLTCYPCPHFRAFTEVRHSEVGDQLQVLRDTRFGERVDARVASQLSEAIEAIRELEAQRCPPS